MGVPGVLKEVYYYSTGRSWVIVSKSETLTENLKELLDSGVIGDSVDSELIARNEEGYPTFKIRRHSINFE
jgi:hypothetical protein